MRVRPKGGVQSESLVMTEEMLVAFCAFECPGQRPDRSTRELQGLRRTMATERR